MKRFIICLLILLVLYPTSANSILKVHTKSGEIVSYAFFEKPIVTFSRECLHISSTKVEIEFPFPEVEKFTFEQSSNDIETINHIMEKDVVCVYTFDGKQIVLDTIEDDPSSIILSDLPVGIYIVKSKSVNYKIEKK